jgi:hypothetical protein
MLIFCRRKKLHSTPAHFAGLLTCSYSAFRPRTKAPPSIFLLKNLLGIPHAVALRSCAWGPIPKLTPVRRQNFGDRAAVTNIFLVKNFATPTRRRRACVFRPRPKVLPSTFFLSTNKNIPFELYPKK